MEMEKAAKEAEAAQRRRGCVGVAARQTLLGGQDVAALY